MKLKKITLTNIRSYLYQEIGFLEGSTLLAGDIGSGKTSVLLGIEFALFGLQPGQRGSSLLRNGEDKGGVIIEFEVENKKVIVERTLKRGKTISQDHCSIEVNGEKKELSVTELKNKVLELLSYPLEFSKKQNILYKFTVYTPQEEMKQIIIQDSETRLNTLRHVFGIDKYKKILENASILSLKIREEKRLKEGFTLNLEQDKKNISLKEEELNSKNSELVLIEKELFLKIEFRKKIQIEKEEVAKKIQEKNNLNQELEKTKMTISHKNNSIYDNLKTIEQIQTQIQKLENLEFDESKIISYEQEIISKKNEKEKISEINLNISSQINSLILKNEENKKLEQKFSNLEICPTCLQNVDAVYRANVLNKAHSNLRENNQKIQELEIEKSSTYEKLKQIETEISLIENKITDLKILKMKLQESEEKKKRISEIENLNLFLKKDIILLNQHSETLNKSIFELGKSENIFELKQKEFEECFHQERIAEIKVAELKREIQVFSAQIDELIVRIKKIEEIKEKLNYLNELENWISKKFIPVISFIEKNVMVRLKSEFSKLFEEWFCILVSDSFNVRLDDDFTPIIEQQDYEIDYAYLSGGERTAIALAYRLSLNQVINSFLSKIKTKDIVILDEPTDGFSDQQLDKMRDVLQQLNVLQLIIVSHEQKMEDFVENVVRFTKEKGISKMEN